MVFSKRDYSTLVVSSSEKFNDSVKPILASAHCEPVTFTESIAFAKRLTLENHFDFVIINSPLPDEVGTKFAIDVSSEKNTVCLLLVKTELYDEIRSKVIAHGVFTLAKPTSAILIAHSLDFMASACERLKKFEKKAVTIEEKMVEIRLVNRAKWLLIENLKMTEPDAHRYIEKQAMDRCISKREIAEDIVKTYS